MSRLIDRRQLRQFCESMNSLSQSQQDAEVNRLLGLGQKIRPLDFPPLGSDKPAKTLVKISLTYANKAELAIRAEHFELATWLISKVEDPDLNFLLKETLDQQMRDTARELWS